MSKDKPTPNEVQIMLDGFISTTKQWRDFTDITLGEIKADVKETKEHAKYTNGRVTKLEEWSSQTSSLIEELVKSKKEVETIKTDLQSKWTAVRWASAIIITVGGLTLTLYTKEISRDTAQKIVSNLESKYNLTQ